MRPRLAIPLTLVLSCLVLAGGTAVWWSTHGHEVELEVHVVCPDADLFVGSEWIGRGRGTFIIDREDFRLRPLPADSVPGSLTGVFPRLGPGSAILLESSEGFFGQANVGGVVRGVEVHSVLLEHRDESVDAGLVLTRFSEEKGGTNATGVLLRARGGAGRALHFVDGELSGQLHSWLDRLSGRPVQRMELTLRLGPPPDAEAVDLERRRFGVDALPVPPSEGIGAPR